MNKREIMKTLSLRLDDEVYEAIKEIAEKEDRSINKAIAQAIKKYIKDNK